MEITVKDEEGCDRGIIFCPQCGAYGVEICLGTYAGKTLTIPHKPSENPDEPYDNKHPTYFNIYNHTRYCLTCMYKVFLSHNHSIICEGNSCGYFSVICVY